MAAAAIRYRVSAREAEGFDSYGRAGEAWPRRPAPPREIRVLDQDHDPPGRQVDGQFAIGRWTLAVLAADKQLHVEPIDVTADQMFAPPSTEGAA